MIDRWLLSYRARPIDLAVFRIVYCVLVLGVYLPRGSWLGAMPDAAFMPPPGLALLFAGFPSHEVALGLNVVALVAVTTLGVGFAPVMSSFVLSASLVAINSFVYSTGKIDHMILVELVPAVMAFSGWGACLSVSRRHHPAPQESRPCWPLAILGLAIGVAMFTAAWAKASTGWLDPATQAVRGHFLANLLMSNREPLAASLVHLLPVWVWEVKDYASVILELLLLPALLIPGFFRVVLVLAALFHLGVWLTFEIPFWSNLLAYLPFFGGWRVRDVPLPRFAVAVPVAWSAYVISRDIPVAPAWFEGLLVVAGAVLAVGWLLVASRRPAPEPA
ncbi:MAG: HTTM domain-containing protein [Vicinamibacterales bacterium]